MLTKQDATCGSIYSTMVHSNLLNPLHIQKYLKHLLQSNKEVLKKQELSHAEHMNEQAMKRPISGPITDYENLTPPQWDASLIKLIRTGWDIAWLNEMSAIVLSMKTQRQQSKDMAARQSEAWRERERENKTAYKRVYKNQLFEQQITHNRVTGHLTVSLIFLWALAWYPLWAQNPFLPRAEVTSCSRQCCQATLFSRTFYQEMLRPAASSKTAPLLWKTQMETVIMEDGRYAQTARWRGDRAPALWSRH